MEIQTQVHTIFMMIGPTECGKTTFAKEVLMSQLKLEDTSRNLKTNVQYLSLESICQELLGFDYDKYDQVIQETSDQAVQLLYDKLKLVTSFPINSEFVILDTTGLADDFRDQISEIAQTNHYNLEVIVFDYDNRKEYYASERSKKLIMGHINRLRRDVLEALPREGYVKIHKVRAKDFYSISEGQASTEYKVTIKDWQKYVSTILPQGQKHIIVGDVHECVQDLQSLLGNYGFRMEEGKLMATDKVRDTKVILVGNWIGKGKQTQEIIDFLYENQAHFLFVIGNHEHYVNQCMKGEIQDVAFDLLNSCYNSTKVLAQNASLLSKFYHLVSISHPFYRFNGVHGPSFYVTHAPCHKKYIGKLDEDSQQHQRNLRDDRTASLEEQLDFLKEEAANKHPFHLFGQVAINDSFRIKNKIHLSGSVHGKELTSVSVSVNLFFKSQKSLNPFIQEEMPILFEEQKQVDLENLNDEELRRLDYYARNKINYISGMMAVVDKDEATGELESFKKGLDYFAEHGVQKVVLQPKYMGSRCNIYLYRDLNKCFAVSRNGYKIHNVDLKVIYKKLLEKFYQYMQEHRIAVLILDGEIMPWKAMSDKYIQRQEKVIDKALETELEFLQQNGFDQAIVKLTEEYHTSGFEKDRIHLPKAALSDKYGENVYQSYKHVPEILGTYVPLSEHMEAYHIYKRQLELYAEDTELEYKPFMLLKEVFENGEERIPDGKTSDIFRFVSDDEIMVLDLTDPDRYEQAESYFSRLIEENIEGVVIKPETVVSHAAPYMKVSNPKYLSIIYGYDYQFPHRYRELMEQHNFSLLLQTCMNDYQLVKRLLSVKHNEITPDNQHYKTIVASLLFGDSIRW